MDHYTSDFGAYRMGSLYSIEFLLKSPKMRQVTSSFHVWKKCIAKPVVSCSDQAGLPKPNLLRDHADVLGSGRQTSEGQSLLRFDESS